MKFAPLSNPLSTLLLAIAIAGACIFAVDAIAQLDLERQPAAVGPGAGAAQHQAQNNAGQHAEPAKAWDNTPASRNGARGPGTAIPDYIGPDSGPDSWQAADRQESGSETLSQPAIPPELMIEEPPKPPFREYQ